MIHCSRQLRNPSANLPEKISRVPEAGYNFNTRPLEGRYKKNVRRQWHKRQCIWTRF